MIMKIYFDWEIFTKNIPYVEIECQISFVKFVLICSFISKNR